MTKENECRDEQVTMGYIYCVSRYTSRDDNLIIKETCLLVVYEIICSLLPILTVSQVSSDMKWKGR